MSFLEESKARDAVTRALGMAFIVPPTGRRVDRATVEWELIHRRDYDDRPIYRTRINEDGILLGGFVGERTAASRLPSAAEMAANGGLV
jgi:hypothetical protein